MENNDADSPGNGLIAEARKFRRQAEEATLPWYRERLLKLARDLEAKAAELEAEKGPDNVRPLRKS
jgi:hypothetical protein